jgi:hypothetical protein
MEKSFDTDDEPSGSFIRPPGGGMLGKRSVDSPRSKEEPNKWEPGTTAAAAKPKPRIGMLELAKLRQKSTEDLFSGYSSTNSMNLKDLNIEVINSPRSRSSTSTPPNSYKQQNSNNNNTWLWMRIRFDDSDAYWHATHIATHATADLSTDHVSQQHPHPATLLRRERSGVAPALAHSQHLGALLAAPPAAAALLAHQPHQRPRLFSALLLFLLAFAFFLLVVVHLCVALLLGLQPSAGLDRLPPRFEEHPAAHVVALSADVRVERPQAALAADGALPARFVAAGHLVVAHALAQRVAAHLAPGLAGQLPLGARQQHGLTAGLAAIAGHDAVAFAGDLARQRRLEHHARVAQLAHAQAMDAQPAQELPIQQGHQHARPCALFVVVIVVIVSVVARIVGCSDLQEPA